ncbi:MAG: hypothetical protein Q4C65_02505 [Eubacteriales bacterium]|nr:hypothetical protein [Eubacteriales bacterium]
MGEIANIAGIKQDTSELRELVNVMESAGLNIQVPKRDIDLQHGYKKLSINANSQKQVSALYSQLPGLIGAASMADCYIVKYPAGLPQILTPLKQGGFATMIQGEQGKFVGMASLHPLVAQAAFVGIFSTMSLASGQYYLAMINNELGMIRESVDKILEFLYGDKRAELMSEVSFVKYAYQNFSSIMMHNEQRAATITSLQEAKKVAMKDIEFFMNDLDNTVKDKSLSDIDALMEQAGKIKHCLDISMQLYGMANILETYYSENYDKDYIGYVKNEMRIQIQRCERRVLGNFSELRKRVDDYKEGIGRKKIDKQAYETMIGELVDSLTTGEDSVLGKNLQNALQAMVSEREYCITAEGDIYLKTA